MKDADEKELSATGVTLQPNKSKVFYHGISSLLFKVYSLNMETNGKLAVYVDNQLATYLTKESNSVYVEGKQISVTNKGPTAEHVDAIII